MTAHLPAVPAQQAPAVRPTDAVAGLREAIMAADAERAVLAERGDVDALAFGLVGLRALRADLAELARAVEDDVARLMPAKTVTVDGVGTLERRRSNVRRQWESEALARVVVLRALVDPETGEMPSSPMEAAERAVAALMACAPFTASMGWRVTALRDHGIDVDQYHESTPGRTTVTVHGADK